MTTDERATNDRLRSVFAEVLEIEPSSIKPDSSPETLDTWDSFAHMRLVMAIENEFRMSLTMEQILAIEDFRSLRDVVIQVARK